MGRIRFLIDRTAGKNIWYDESQIASKFQRTNKAGLQQTLKLPAFIFSVTSHNIYSLSFLQSSKSPISGWALLYAFINSGVLTCV